MPSSASVAARVSESWIFIAVMEPGPRGQPRRLCLPVASAAHRAQIRLAAGAHAHALPGRLQRRRRLAADHFGARGLRPPSSISSSRRRRDKPAGSERQGAGGASLARGETQGRDADGTQRTRVDAEVGEQLPRLAAEEVAAHFEGWPARALDDGDAGAAAGKLERERRARQAATDRNGIEVRHAAITARGKAARNRRRQSRGG